MTVPIPTRTAPTVLLVDDEPANLQVLRQILQPHYRLLFAKDGAKALELARTGHPDLILLDVMMPGLTGLEVCEQLKQDPSTAQVPVIFVTALHDEEDEMRGLAAGAVVINGVGLLPGVESALRHCALGADGPLPFVHSRLETLEATLEHLIAQGAPALTALGRRNRAWMERHWAFEAQWPAFWAAACGDAARARHTPSASASASLSLSFSLPAPSADCPPSPEVSAMPTLPAAAARPLPPPLPATPRVSVIVPHGGAERLAQLMCTLACLRQQRGVPLELVVVEMGPVPLAREAARRWAAQHLFIAHDGLFERARALNAGQAVATGELLLWHDNDLLAAPDFIATAVQELRERQLDYLVPYADVRYLSPADSLAVMQGTRAPRTCRPVRVLVSGSGASGGAGLVRASFLAAQGGLIEGFRGWGGEDNAWNHKVGLLGRPGHSRRPGQQMHHLHHASSGGPAPGAASAANPHYAANVALLRDVGALRQAGVDARYFLLESPHGHLASGTDALLSAAMALEIGLGTSYKGPGHGFDTEGEVVTTAYSFFATPETAVRLGARPVFADLAEDSFNADVDDLLNKCSKKTRAILPVHTFGRRLDVTRLVATGIPVIEDAAQTLVPGIGHRTACATLSFFPTKNLGAVGDAGPRLIVSPSGAATVSWTRWRNRSSPTAVLSATRPAGGDFGGPKRVATAGPNAIALIAGNDRGDAAIVWEQDDTKRELGPMSIHAAFRAGAGGTFGPDTPLSRSGRHNLWPSASVAPDGRTVIAWTSFERTVEARSRTAAGVLRPRRVLSRDNLEGTFTAALATGPGVVAWFDGKATVEDVGPDVPPGFLRTATATADGAFGRAHTWFTTHAFPESPFVFALGDGLLVVTPHGSIRRRAGLP